MLKVRNVCREGMIKVWRGFENEILQYPLAQHQKMDFSQPCDEYYQLHVLDVSPINRVTKSPSERINMCMVAPWLQIDPTKLQIFMQHDIQR